MKLIVFLIIASLLVIGLVLPGCVVEEELEPVLYTFEDGKINIGVAGELNYTAGETQWAGAMLALIGLFFLSVKGSLDVNPGDILVLIGAFFWTGHVLVIGRFSPHVD